ncbi:MAG: GNAT family N-acetyltransferase, partial [Planctomycetota bacterium]
MVKKTAEQKLHLRGQVVQEPSDIAALAKDWDDLFERVHEAPAYLSRTWAETFINEKHVRGEPLIIAVWCGSKLVALLPLCVRSFCGVRLAEPIGTTEPSYLGLLADTNYPSAISTIADVWIQKKVAHAFYNKYLSSLDEATNQLISELAHRGLASKRGHQRVSPWVRLGCSFDEYLEKTKTGKRRRKLLYQERQVFKAGDVAVVRYAGKDITPEVTGRIATIQQESWMKRRGAAILGHPFYQKLLTAMAKAGLGRVWLMTMNGDDIAFAYTLAAHKKLDLKWIAFRLKYESSLSFGKILTMQMIHDACKEGILSFDFGMGDSEYKQFWATDNHSVERAVAGRGLWGYLLVLWYGA